jgi:sulfatase maturation enzyme AslB (radical SAM superfamily)
MEKIDFGSIEQNGNKNILVKNSEYNPNTLKIILYIHNYCNLHCNYCEANKNNSEMPLLVLDDLYLFIKKYKIMNKVENIEIVLQGGETSLNFKLLYKVIIKLNKIKKIIAIKKILFFTNLVVPAPELSKIINLFKKFNFDFLLEGSIHFSNITKTHYDNIYNNIVRFRPFIGHINILCDTELSVSTADAHKLINLIKKFNIDIYNSFIDYSIKPELQPSLNGDNLLKNDFNIEYLNLAPNLIIEPHNLKIPYIDFMKEFEKYEKLCNIQNVLTIDFNGIVKYCGNFDSYYSDIIPTMLFNEENFDNIYKLVFTESCVACDQPFCISGLFKDIKCTRK